MIQCAKTFAFVGPAMKMAIAFPVSLHYMNGIRHLVWDQNPAMLTTAQVTQQSYAVMGAAGVVALGSAMITLSPAEEKEN